MPKLCALLGYVLLLASSGLAWGASEDKQVTQDARLREHLQEPVTEYELHADNMLQALMQISARFQLPMGVEWSQDSRTNKEDRRSTSQERVESSSMSRWVGTRIMTGQSGTGQSTVYPRWANDDHSFLHLPIADFSEKDTFVLFASRDLQKIVNAIVAPVIAGRGRGGSVATGLGDRRVTIELKNSSVEQILSAFLAAADFKIWVITYTGRDDVTATGFRRTISLYSGQSVPDESQPVWNLLRWDRIQSTSTTDAAGGITQSTVARSEI